MYTDGNVSWPPKVFKSLNDISKISSTMRKEKLSSFANEIGGDASVSQGQNTFFLTFSFANNPDISPEFIGELYDRVDVVVKELFFAAGLILTMAFQPMPRVLYAQRAHDNVLGLDRFQDDLINVLFTLMWPLSINNELVYARMKILESELIELAQKKGIYNEWIYLNYASQWQDPIKGYGEDEVAFLRSVSREYDPDLVHQKAVPGGFELGLETQ